MVTGAGEGASGVFANGCGVPLGVMRKFWNEIVVVQFGNDLIPTEGETYL